MLDPKKCIEKTKDCCVCSNVFSIHKYTINLIFCKYWGDIYGYESLQKN
jgi:hypothetical protein